LDTALDVAAAACALPPGGASALGPASVFTRHKFATETTLLALAITRTPDIPIPILGRAFDIAKRVSPLARSPEVLTAMQLRPALAPEMSMAHVMLTRMGLPDNTFDDHLEAILTSSCIGSLERLPWKQIESDWTSTLGGHPVGYNIASALAWCAASHRLDVLAAQREELYSFTHSLIYATDFGHRSDPKLADPAMIAVDADDAIARCLDEDDFDLVAELTLTRPYLRLSWSPTSVFAFQVLAGMEDEIGLIPSMSLKSSVADTLPEEARREYIIAQSYHAAYVMGLLIVAALLPGRRPPESLPADATTSAPGLGRRLFSLLPARSPRPHWMRLFEALDEPRQDGLATLLGAIAVRRAVTSFDVDVLATILTSVFSEELPPTPAINQASELYLRLCMTAEGRCAGE